MGHRVPELDFCHNVPYTKYAPWVAGISVSKQGEPVKKIFTAEEGVREGSAHVFKSDFRAKKNKYKTETLKTHVSGLDAGEGSVEYAVGVHEDGEYILTIYTHERYNNFDKFLIAIVNDDTIYTINIPKNIRWNVSSAPRAIMPRTAVRPSAKWCFPYASGASASPIFGARAPAIYGAPPAISPPIGSPYAPYKNATSSSTSTPE